jgi:hypothetical protein
MSTLPDYIPPDFNLPGLVSAPVARTIAAPADGIAPEDFHATSNHPEYVHLGERQWLIARESRMDAVMVLRGRSLEIVEPRLLKKGDPVMVGRGENGEDGIYVHTVGFEQHGHTTEKFGFRIHGSRETPFSRSYDRLYDLLRHDRDQCPGFHSQPAA